MNVLQEYYIFKDLLGAKMAKRQLKSKENFSLISVQKLP